MARWGKPTEDGMGRKLDAGRNAVGEPKAALGAFMAVTSVQCSPVVAVLTRVG